MEERNLPSPYGFPHSSCWGKFAPVMRPFFSLSVNWSFFSIWFFERKESEIKVQHLAALLFLFTGDLHLQKISYLYRFIEIGIGRHRLKIILQLKYVRCFHLSPGSEHPLTMHTLRWYIRIRIQVLKLHLIKNFQLFITFLYLFLTRRMSCFEEKNSGYSLILIKKIKHSLHYTCICKMRHSELSKSGSSPTLF